ncbi:MAG TPA: MarR family winged helix-turn-helix transcriptional regulator [Opitutaceae bacterium]|nr:MarR family winged helix-turn-helix transcriptional regulator [Opitutaceae bacterium]
MTSSRSPLRRSHYELLAAFRYALNRFLHFSQEAARRAGLTPQQHQALLTIKGFPGGHVSVGDLAERLQLRHHSAVGLVDRLVDRRLVRRVASRADRRRVEIRLAPRGAALIRRLSAVHLREVRKLGPKLRILLDSLSRVV